MTTTRLYNYEYIHAPFTKRSETISCLAFMGMLIDPVRMVNGYIPYTSMYLYNAVNNEFQIISCFALINLYCIII